MELTTHEWGWPVILLIFMLGSIFSSVGIGLLLSRSESGERQITVFSVSAAAWGLLFVVTSGSEMLTRWGLDLNNRADVIFGLFLVALSGSSQTPVLGGLIAGWPRWRPTTRLCYILLSALALGVGLAGAIRVLDVTLGLLPFVSKATFLRDLIGLELWETPALTLYSGIALPVAAYALARAPVTGVEEDAGAAHVSVRFAGRSHAIRRLSKWLMVAGVLAAASYCWFFFLDSAFGTSLTSWFGWVGEIEQAVRPLNEARRFYWEWIAFLGTAGICIAVLIAERRVGCLTAFLMALALYFCWIFSSGLLDDWQGPFLQAVTAIKSWL